MKKLYSILLLAFIAGSVLTLNSCSKDDPEPEIEMEEPDRALLTFTKLDDAGQETTTKVTVDFDELAHDHASESSSGTSTSADEDAHVHPHIHLDANSTYRLQIEMFRDGAMINDEFLKAADVHQFFFFPQDEEGNAVNGFINYVYEDKDQNNLPIGLKGKFMVLTEGEADIKVILSHGLDKSKVPAGVYNYADYALIGDTDLDQVFELHVGTH